MRDIDRVIVHCSATKPSMDVDAALIRKWHVEERSWSDIGYHFVIKRDGEIEQGRAIDVIGAHCRGHNTDSVGICLVGGLSDEGEPAENFLGVQYQSLYELLKSFRLIFPDVDIVGHRDLDDRKDCPCFEVGQWVGSVDL